MGCAFDDDPTVVVAMVDFAISAQFGLMYSKKNSWLENLSSPTVLIVELSNFYTSFHFLIMDYAFDDNRTNLVAMVDLAIS